MRKTSTENNLLECLLSSVHILLIRTVLSAVCLIRNIAVTCGKELSSTVDNISADLL
jgi:hypothetical protein